MDRHGIAVWPNALAVVDCTYTISQGISANVALLRILPQPTFPAMFGNLTITDGVGTVVVPDCKIDQLKVEHGPNGVVWNLEILDRRWKWKDLGALSGCYNQLDPHGKLIPWTIRSPEELAVLCLSSMDEVGYVIDMPPGLTRAVGANIDNYLANGNNFPPTGVNPPVNWDCVPPAQALQGLCDLFGRRIVYDLASNIVRVVRPGVGAQLPTSGVSIAKQGPALNDPETPDGVGVVGAPIRYQAQFVLQAVGEDWNGAYVPVDALSYAPEVEGKPQITTATVGDVAAAKLTAQRYQLWLYGNGSPAFAMGVMFEYVTTPADTDNSVAAALAALVNASQDPKVKNLITAAVAGNVLTLTSVGNGTSFDAEGRINPNPQPGRLTLATTQFAVPGGRSWEYAPPPLFPGVKEVPGRLTYQQAVGLAQKSVWKYFRITLLNPDLKGTLKIPGYLAPIKRIQQILLQDTQCEQVVPEPEVKGVQVPPGYPYIHDFYNGYSRDKPAVCYGSTQLFSQNLYRPHAADINTDQNEQIFTPFTIDATWQMVIFANHVYRIVNGKCQESAIVLQTACNIRNQETNEIERFFHSKLLAGQNNRTNFQFGKYEDVQVNVVSAYDDKGNVTKVELLEQDPLFRADYYLQGLAAQYRVTDAQVIEYNGIEPIFLDGVIQQVTWSVGEGGASTQASRNTEHQIWVPPYPARRRAEQLPPTKLDNREARIQPAKPKEV